MFALAVVPPPVVLYVASYEEHVTLTDLRLAENLFPQQIIPNGLLTVLFRVFVSWRNLLFDATTSLLNDFVVLLLREWSTNLIFKYALQALENCIIMGITHLADTIFIDSLFISVVNNS